MVGGNEITVEAAYRQMGDEAPERGAVAYDDMDEREKAYVRARAGQESEIPNFKGSYLGRLPLVSADFWTSDHLLERSRSVDAFSGAHARGTFTLKRR
jgi:hypothetical protein